MTTLPWRRTETMVVKEESPRSGAKMPYAHSYGGGEVDFNCRTGEGTSGDCDGDGVPLWRSRLAAKQPQTRFRGLPHGPQSWFWGARPSGSKPSPQGVSGSGAVVTTGC
jgi:hypothetical protein